MGKIVSWYIIICVLGGFWQGSIWQESIVDVCQDLVTCYPVGDRKSSGQNRVRRQPTFLAYRTIRDGNSYIIFNTDIVVILTAERREHIEQRHPEVDLTDIHTALLWGDVEKNRGFRYYRGNKIKVVVKMISEDRGEIITAYYNSGGDSDG